MGEHIKRDFPGKDFIGKEFIGTGYCSGRKAVCKRCHCVMNDFEPSCRTGEFFHPREDKEGKPHWCKNAGKYFTTADLELEPFLRKRDRRRQKRLGIKI